MSIRARVRWLARAPLRWRMARALRGINAAGAMFGHPPATWRQVMRGCRRLIEVAPMMGVSVTEAASALELIAASGGAMPAARKC